MSADAPGTIRLDQIWKRFRIDEEPGRFAIHEFERARNLLRGDHQSGWRWVLRDVSLEVEPGGSCGIIGVNGSGKSTLLKMAAGVTYPYAGRVSVSGRIGAVMDLQAGIQQDLTGRENVMLYGRLLGRSRRQMDAALEEIIEFADIADAVDRQVKFYSSGMGVRLGFSIVAHLDPEVLIVDEALAVGDADFRRKCMQRMREIIEGGASLLYVSHGLESVQAMCAQAMWLDGGVVRAQGVTEDVLAEYRESTGRDVIESGEQAVHVQAVVVKDDGPIKVAGDASIELIVTADERRSVSLTIGISQGEVDPFVTATLPVALAPGLNRFRLELRNLPMGAGRYRLWATTNGPDGHSLSAWQPVAWMQVFGRKLPETPTGVSRLAPIWLDASLHRDED